MKGHVMKKKFFLLFFCVGFIVTLFLGILLDVDYKNNLITENDISIYRTEEYGYLPKYDEFDYKDYITDFYLYDSTKTLQAQIVSYVLELSFESYNQYSKFIEYETNRYIYGEDYSILKNNYECYLCTDEAITLYYYDEDMPFTLGMLCLNETDLKVRYIYYINIEWAVDKKYEDVFKYTNCDW